MRTHFLLHLKNSLKGPNCSNFVDQFLTARAIMNALALTVIEYQLSFPE